MKKFIFVTALSALISPLAQALLVNGTISGCTSEMIYATPLCWLEVSTPMVSVVDAAEFDCESTGAQNQLTMEALSSAPTSELPTIALCAEKMGLSSEVLRNNLTQ